MITFETNIFFGYKYKEDYIAVSTKKYIHYQITTTAQQERWFVAVTVIDNGEVIQRKDLSKIFNKGFSGVNEYIQQLPNIVENQIVETTHINIMKDEFLMLKGKLIFILEAMNTFEKKYFGE